MGHHVMTCQSAKIHEDSKLQMGFVDVSGCLFYALHSKQFHRVRVPHSASKLEAATVGCFKKAVGREQTRHALPDKPPSKRSPSAESLVRTGYLRGRPYCLTASYDCSNASTRNRNQHEPYWEILASCCQVRIRKNSGLNPPAPKVLGRDRPDGTRERLQVYLGGAFFGQNLLFLIGRDARLQKTL